MIDPSAVLAQKLNPLGSQHSACVHNATCELVAGTVSEKQLIP